MARCLACRSDRTSRSDRTCWSDTTVIPLDSQVAVVKAIVFDLDGTLISFREPYENVLEQTFESVVGTSRSVWVETYDEAFFDLFMALESNPVERAFEHVASTEDEFEIDSSLLAAQLHSYECELSETPPSLEADLYRLRDEGYALAVLTNGVNEWQRVKLRSAGIETHFDAVVASYEAGAHKPDLAPFRLLESRLDADSYAMVGDSDADVEGAKSAGWMAHRYDGGGFGTLPAAIE